MPAVTVGQLQQALASSSHNSTFFMESGGRFFSYANELGPRIYHMGIWSDLLDTRTHSGADGYVSLDRDIATVYSANVNNSPQRIRSIAHDLRTLGNVAFLPERYGLVDMGEFAVRRELATIQGATTYADIVPIGTLHLTNAAGTATVSSTLAGATVEVIGITGDGERVPGVLTASNDATPVSTVEFATDVMNFESIISTGLPAAIELRVTANDATTMIATMKAGTDVVRYRRYRVGGAQTDTYCHLLCKRAWVDVTRANDIIYLGNLSVWKHAMLAKVAEDNGDVELRAPYHWKQCLQILNEDLSDHTGAATGTLQMDMWGGAAVGLQAQM